MELSNSQNSFARLVKSLENHDESAAAFIYTKYIGRLIKLASQKLDPRLDARVYPETVAHTVIKLFFDKFQKKEIEFENWEALYGYLAKVTIRKALNRNRLHWQLKRGGGRRTFKAIILINSSLKKSLRITRSQIQQKLPRLMIRSRKRWKN